MANIKLQRLVFDLTVNDRAIAVLQPPSLFRLGRGYSFWLGCGDGEKVKPLFSRSNLPYNPPTLPQISFGLSLAIVVG